MAQEKDAQEKEKKALPQAKSQSIRVVARFFSKNFFYSFF